MRPLTALTLLSLLFVNVACYRGPASMAEKRIAYAKKGVGEIVIAVFDDGLDSSYIDAISLVVKRLNAVENGLLGRPVKLFITDGHGDFDDIRDSIRLVADNPKITAVLGHRFSSVAVPASVIYEDANLLFVSPFATSGKLTAHDFRFVLRGLPDEDQIAAQTADIALLFGYKRIAVLRARDDYSRNLAFLFEDEIREKPGIDIVFRGSFFGDQDNYRSLLGQLKGIDFDALYLSTDAEPGARIIEQLRELRLDQPILGSDSLFGDRGGLEFTELRNNAADRTIVPVIYNLGNTSPQNRLFIQSFRKNYGYLPTLDAAQGYKLMNMLADIIRRAGTTNPEVLSTTAHWSPPIAGLSGIHAYDTSGNIYGMRYDFNILRFGKWFPLPAVNLPYAFNEFRTARPKNTKNLIEGADNKKMLHTSSKVASAIKERGAQELNGAHDQKVRTYEGRAERFQRNFALAHELIGFKRLGLLLGHTQNNKETTSLVSIAARQGNFEIESCQLPSPDSLSVQQNNTTADNAGESDASLEMAVTNCYSHLYRTIDAMFVIPDYGIDDDVLRRLNRTLIGFDVPSFAIDENSGIDYGLSMVVNTSSLGLDDPAVASRFDGVIKDMEVHHLNRKLSKYPTVAMDLSILEADLLSRNQLIIVSEVLDSESVEAF